MYSQTETTYCAFFITVSVSIYGAFLGQLWVQHTRDFFDDLFRGLLLMLSHSDHTIYGGVILVVSSKYLAISEGCIIRKSDI